MGLMREKRKTKGSGEAVGFCKEKPQFSCTANGNYLTIRVRPVDGATGYEVARSEKRLTGYETIANDPSPVLEIHVADGKSYHYKVRAYSVSENGRLETPWSDSQYGDLVSAARARDARLDHFFLSLKEIGDVLGYEDLDVAIETLKLATLEVKEKEERRRLEEEAEKKKEEIEQQNKRRKEAARRAAARREKRRLQHVEKVTRMDLPLDFVNAFADDERVTDQHCDTAHEALMMSLDLLGMVDIEFIASVTGEDLRTVIENLRGTIYQNPLHWNEVFYKGWETADEYLSGNLVHKLQIAKDANEKYNGYFQNNVSALESLMEPDLDPSEIYATLGSPWIPADIIDDFIAYMALGENLSSPAARSYFSQCSAADFAVRHDEYTGLWEIPNKTRFRTNSFHRSFEKACCEVFGTDRMDMLYVLENTLNMKTLTVTDLKDPSDKKSTARILNHNETVKLLERQKHMIDTFKKWVWADEERKNRLRAAYCRKYGNVKKRVFDGSFLELPGLSDKISLYDYQKNAVARILFSPNTLLAHDVGSGKTFVMIAAGMELRRLGRSKKNLYVIPNNIISQWENTFRTMYPDAKILTVSQRNFCPSRRGETLNRIKTEDFDAILMTYSCFDMLSLSDKYYMKIYQERLELLEKANKNFHSAKTLNQKREQIQNALDKLRQTYKKAPKIMPFDELGINTLFVDEAHNYKNVSLGSHISRVRGMGNSGSGKANAMMDKVHCVQRMNHGGRVVFATGTPVTNSLSDIYVMQRYLQEGELEFQGIRNFDAWAGMFAEKTTNFEIDVDTNSYHLVTRFSRFCNIPELSATLSSIADFHQVDRAAGIPAHDGYLDSLREGSDDFKDYLREISNRADDIRQKRVKPKEDNMLKITSDGRKAALDMRLIDVAFGLDPDSKVMRCAENVFDVYSRTRETRGTQLVFCDISTPKDHFNLYDELKKLLIAMGIPEKEIAFVHDAETDLQRQDLFRAVREGEIAVLIGSTVKMGHGVNVQKHLVALHHLDVPWRPSDMVQREGRILRQGNENEKVLLFRYVTKASFDAYSWQLLETKQRFIGQIMSGSAAMREGADVDDTVLNYAEVKALAVGNPKIKRRVETANELQKYLILRADALEYRRMKERDRELLPQRIAYQKKVIALCEKDMEEYRKEKIDYNALKYEEQKEIRERIYRAVIANQNSEAETEVLTFQGFRVVVPAYMIPRVICHKDRDESGEARVSREIVPYVHLVKNGTYTLEIESESGITKRLNNFLEGMGDLKIRYEEVLKDLEDKLRLTEEELKKEFNGYQDEIDSLSRELKELDEELGVAS